MTVPPPCEPLELAIADLNDEIKGLQDLLNGIGLPPGDPPLNSSEKAAIGRQINKLRGQLKAAELDLASCVAANTPPPDPGTVPTLSVTRIEAVQVVQTPANSLALIMTKPTAVRVFVASGVSNGFDAGAGANRWPGVTGELRVVDPVGGAVIAGPLAPLTPHMIAQPAGFISGSNPLHSLNFRLRGRPGVDPRGRHRHRRVRFTCANQVVLDGAESGTRRLLAMLRPRTGPNRPSCKSPGRPAIAISDADSAADSSGVRDDASATAFYERHQDRLRRQVTRDTPASAETVEDACAYAWLPWARRRGGPRAWRWLFVVAWREAWRPHRIEARDADQAVEPAAVERLEDRRLDPELPIGLRHALAGLIVSSSARGQRAARRLAA